MISPVRNPRRRAARLMATLLLVLVASSLLAPDAVRSWADPHPAGWRRVLARPGSGPLGFVRKPRNKCILENYDWPDAWLIVFVAGWLAG